MGAVMFREANRADVPAVVGLLTDDVLGAGRESAAMSPYLAAFDAIETEPCNHLIVGERAGRIVATYQITFISGLSLQASRRAQIEAVRVASDLRGQGIGQALFADADRRAGAAGCALLQLTTHRARGEAQAFYDRLGFTASHIGYKRAVTPRTED
jgi:GNAT superfamily N-acetyltransferase